MVCDRANFAHKHGLALSTLQRKGLDGLYGLARDKLGLEVRSGHLADEQKDSATVEKWRPYVCEVAAAMQSVCCKSGPAVPLGPQ